MSRPEIGGDNLRNDFWLAVIASAKIARNICAMIFGIGRDCFGQKSAGIFYMMIFGIGRECLGQILLEIFFMIGRDCLGQKLAGIIYVMIFGVGRVVVSAVNC